MESQSTEIGRIQKNKTTSTLIQLIRYKDQNYLDIREFFTTPNGKFLPTKKGVAIPVSKLSEMVNIVEQAEAQLNEFQNRR